MSVPSAGISSPHFYDYDVAHDNVLACDFHHFAVAAHLHGRLFAKRGKHVELLGGVHLKPETDGGGQDDGQDDADGFNEIAWIAANASDMTAATSKILMMGSLYFSR